MSKCGCVYADASNTDSVRKGFEMGGYLKTPCARHGGEKKVVMKQRERIIAVDVDEVCANLLDAWLWEYNYKYNDSVAVEDIKDWGITKYITKCKTDQFYDILRADYNGMEFYDFVYSIPGALEEIKKLRTLGRVIFVTSCSPGTMDQKHRWLMREGFLPESKFTPKDLVLAADKSLVRADVLLDDAIHNVEAFPGHAFLVPHTHNENESTWRERLPGPGLNGAYERIERLFKST